MPEPVTLKVLSAPLPVKVAVAEPSLENAMSPVADAALKTLKPERVAQVVPGELDPTAMLVGVT